MNIFFDIGTTNTGTMAAVEVYFNRTEIVQGIEYLAERYVWPAASILAQKGVSLEEAMLLTEAILDREQGIGELVVANLWTYC